MAWPVDESLHAQKFVLGAQSSFAVTLRVEVELVWQGSATETNFNFTPGLWWSSPASQLIVHVVKAVVQFLTFFFFFFLAGSLNLTFLVFAPGSVWPQQPPGERTKCSTKTARSESTPPQPPPPPPPLLQPASWPKLCKWSPSLISVHVSSCWNKSIQSAVPVWNWKHVRASACLHPDPHCAHSS